MAITGHLFSGSTLTFDSGSTLAVAEGCAFTSEDDLTILTSTSNDNIGLLFSYNGGSPYGGLFTQGVNEKMILNGTRITISPNGGALQIGGNNLHCPAFLQVDGVPTAMATTKPSGSLFFVTAYWDGAVPQSTAIGCQAVALDTSGGRALVFYYTPDTTVTGGGTDEIFRLVFSGLSLAEGTNLIAGTSTGTKIGTATGQKLGFWNVTPVAQQVLATGALHTVDDVITLLQTLGLCKQS